MYYVATIKVYTSVQQIAQTVQILTMKTMINLVTMIATTAIISSPATMGTTMIHCRIDSGRAAHPVRGGKDGRGGEGRGGGR